MTVANASTNTTSDTIDLGGVSLDLPSADAEALFQTTIYDNDKECRFAFDVANGTYRSSCISSSSRPIRGVGQRVFDVNFEGETLLNDLDVYALAGGGTIAYRHSRYPLR